jgi:hypothetical protein
VRRVQWIERTVPGQGDELASYLQAKRDRTVQFPSSVVSSYIELIEAAAPVTQEHDVLVCLQIDARRLGREMKRLGGGDAGAASCCCVRSRVWRVGSDRPKSRSSACCARASTPR